MSSTHLVPYTSPFGAGRWRKLSPAPFVIWTGWRERWSSQPPAVRPSLQTSSLKQERHRCRCYENINNQTKHITTQMFGRKFSERKLHLSFLINLLQKGPMCVETTKGCCDEPTRPAFKTQICGEDVFSLPWLVFKPDFLILQYNEFGWASVVWKVSKPDPTTQKS